MSALKVDAAVNAVKLVCARNGVDKGRTTTAQGRYQYRGIDDIVDAVAIHMAEAGLCLYQRTIDHRIEEHKSNKGDALFFCYVTCEFDFVSVEDGSMRTVRFIGESFDSGDKSTGKAETYAYRNCLAKTFVIPVNGAEADSDATEPPPTAPRADYRAVADRVRTEMPPDARAASQRDSADGYSAYMFPTENSMKLLQLPANRAGKPMSDADAQFLAIFIEACRQGAEKSTDPNVIAAMGRSRRAAQWHLDQRMKAEGIT